MSKQTNRLLDTVRANTQVKIYLSISDPQTVRALQDASGLISYSDENGKLTYLPRLNVNHVNFYSGHSDYCICWITRDSGFTAYGGDWFGMRTSYHIEQAEFEAREMAAWPTVSESTIIAERSADGMTARSEGSPQPSQASLFGADEEYAALPVIKADSVWAVRLLQTYERRFGKGGDGNVA